MSETPNRISLKTTRTLISHYGESFLKWLVQLKVKYCSEGLVDLMGIISGLTDLIEGTAVEGSTPG